MGVAHGEGPWVWRSQKPDQRRVSGRVSRHPGRAVIWGKPVLANNPFRGGGVQLLFQRAALPPRSTLSLAREGLAPIPASAQLSHAFAGIATTSCSLAAASHCQGNRVRAASLPQVRSVRSVRSRLNGRRDPDDGRRTLQHELRMSPQTSEAVAARERHRAAAKRERERADQERNRAAGGRKRQAEGLERLDQAAVLSAQGQLNPSELHRARRQALITLRGQPPMADDPGA